MLLMCVFLNNGKKTIRFTHCEAYNAFDREWEIKEAHKGKCFIAAYGNVAPNTYSLISDDITGNYSFPDEIYYEG